LIGRPRDYPAGKPLKPGGGEILQDPPIRFPGYRRS
jgi:hypothetical protein